MNASIINMDVYYLKPGILVFETNNLHRSEKWAVKSTHVQKKEGIRGAPLIYKTTSGLLLSFYFCGIVFWAESLIMLLEHKKKRLGYFRLV